MPNHKLNHSSDWRCRREEYLRASGRREDLISEGYESLGGPQNWPLSMVAAGGQEKRMPESDCSSSSEACRDPGYAVTRVS